MAPLFGGLLAARAVTYPECMPRRALASVLAVPLVTLLLITGCSVSGSDASPGSTSAPVDPSPSSDASEAPADLESLDAGAIITEEQADSLPPAWKGETDLVGYKAADGNIYLVKVNEPLPEPVRADAQAQANTITVKTGTSVQDQDNTITQGKAMSSRLSSSTGKKVVVINYGSVSVAYANGHFGAEPGWLAHNSPLNGEGLLPSGTNLDSVLAEVNALIQAQPDAANYEVIVQQP